MKSEEVKQIKDLLMNKSKEELVDIAYWSMTIPECRKLLGKSPVIGNVAKDGENKNERL